MKGKIGAVIFVAVFAVLFSGIATAVCNDCLLKVIPQKTAGCPSETLIYKLKLTNVNDNQKTFYVSVDSTIKDWISYPATVTLGPYEERLVDLLVNIPSNAKQGTYGIEVTASSGDASDHAKTIATVENCYSASSLLNPNSMVVCRGDLADFTFNIVNNGVKEDVFALTAVTPGLSSSLSQPSASILPGSSATSVLRINTVTAKIGEYNIKALASSARTATEATGTLVIKDCQEGVVNAPQTLAFCYEDASRMFNLTATNSGRDPATYGITVTGTCNAVLSQYQVMLNPGESRNIQVTLRDNNNCVITFGLSNGLTSASTTTEVKVGACYGVDIEIIPPNNPICLCQPLDYDVVVRNTGTRLQTYKVEISSPLGMALNKNVVTLEGGEQEVLKARNVDSTCCTFRGFDYSATAYSPMSRDIDTGKVTINPSETCHALDIQADESRKSVLDCSGVDFALEVRNAGFMEESVRIAVNGPEWITVQPKTFTLDGGLGVGQIIDVVGEVREVGIHVQPPEGTQPGVYPFRVSVSSDNAYDEIQLLADVKSASCKLEPVATPPSGEEDENGVIVPPTTGYITKGVADSMFLVLLIGIVIAAIIVVYSLVEKKSYSRGEGQKPIRLDEIGGDRYVVDEWSNDVSDIPMVEEAASKKKKNKNGERLTRINELIRGE